MRDYILDKLYEKQILCEAFSDQNRHFYALMRREYIIRLMLAILWDTCFLKCSSADKTKAVQLVFGKKPALGDFLEAILILSKYSSEKKMYKEICTYTSKYVIFNRNQYDHKISSEVDKMIGVIDAWISYMKKRGYHYFTNNKDDECEYRFLIPVKEHDKDHVICCCYVNRDRIEPVFINPKMFQKGNGKAGYMNQLYYSIKDGGTGAEEIYKLSPFIHYYKDPLKGVFTLYCSVISRSVSLITDARSLFDEQLSSENTDDILSEKSCRHEFVLGDLQALHESGNFYISAFNNVMVNKSSYREFQMAANNQYKYSESIVQDYCDQVYRFCREKKSQIFIIAGGGGLGKTALLWNVIQKIMVKNLDRANYDLIIFLSAKQNYLVNEPDMKLQMYEDISSDITDCDSLKYKLWKYVYDLSDEEMAENYREINEQELAEQIEKQEKSILLMIDDLDTFVWEEQEAVLRLAASFSATKVKTIISTRNINTNGNKIVMQRMSRENCVKFAKWLIETNYQREGTYWLAKMEEESYQKNVYELSRGIPVFVQTWVRMLVQGISCFKNENVFTERDCIKYLYYTAKNQLCIKEAQMIYILGKICHLCATRIFNRFFLFMISSVETEEERDQCLESLISFQLIQDNGNNTYSLFDFDYSYIDISDQGYYDSEIYQLIFQSMENHPYNWRGQSEFIDELLQCLEKISEYDYASALLLDKLSSEYGSRYCSGLHNKRIMELQRMRDIGNDSSAEIAEIIGVWDGKSYDAKQIECILAKAENSKRNNVRIEILKMTIDCCNEKISDILESEEESDSYIREMKVIWNKIKVIKNNTKEIKELKKQFANRLRELDDE